MGYELDMEHEEICEQGTESPELQAAQRANFDRIGNDAGRRAGRVFVRFQTEGRRAALWCGQPRLR